MDRIEGAFDRPVIEALLSPIRASARGAPGWPPLVMFKIVLLQQWHTLSDPGAEEAGRQAEMTPANVHDSRLGEALIQGDEQGFFADRAYDSQALDRKSVV